ncbi:uncharacterized protein LOC128891200 isoform X1 [Hylaeus anthracinus]|uniref:uncharacterized protein LOC128891200 isoform X1 n=2 Tax=Hylaeus anthracinus TaxID=313031 RepID=UPI0023B9B031|nr:uncharacterized protein LOC128891200 isoform X1 [Hylaeus anthracinus]XP_054006506.1 uncharacterized protein LOC128891200 isoform X1 [Hylaeus anthracinus]
MSVARIWQLIPLLIISSSRVFSASNVCPRIESYTVTSMETYTEPVTVNTFTWCLQLPPRCLKTWTETKKRYRVKTETKTRSVNECCEGYKMISSSDDEIGIRCVPFCENCLSGVCVSPNECRCNPGYRGDNCTAACPAGTWGSQCKEKCDCTQSAPGLLRQTCDESCLDDHQNPEYATRCNCETVSNKCDHETGRCLANETIIPASGKSSQIPETTEITTEVSLETVSTTDNPSETTSPETTTASTPDRPKTRTQAREDGNSSTARPVIVLVSVPERRRNLEKERGKFPMKNPFLRHVDEDVPLRVVPPLETNYAKNVHKDEVQPTPIPLDVALIVVASIVSLGLTSLAVAMVLHMRSKLFETARLSIYDVEKTKSQETESRARISSIVASAVPQSPVRVSPLFTSSPEQGMTLTVAGIDPSCNYANGAATIGLRISGNLRDFLQDDHYDHPPATLIRLQPDLDANGEHIYDEIPLQSSPLRSRKDS